MTSEQLVYDEAVMAVQELERTLEAIVRRAWALLAMLALVMALLGADVFARTDGPGRWGWVGAIAAVVSATLAFATVLPGDAWVFRHDPLTLLGEQGATAPPAELHRQLAERRAAHLKEHAGLARPLSNNVRFAAIAFVVAVAAMLLQLASG